MTDERINFEGWLTATYKWADTDMNIRGQYSDDYIHFMWEAWQACHQLKPQGLDSRTSDLSCSWLELTRRTLNCLTCGGVSTVGQLVSCTEVDLLKMTSMGKKSVIEIKDVLNSRGLSLSIKSMSPGPQ